MIKVKKQITVGLIIIILAGVLSFTLIAARPAKAWVTTFCVNLFLSAYSATLECYNMCQGREDGGDSPYNLPSELRQCIKESRNCVASQVLWRDMGTACQF